MRIAALYDIHGNLPALESVLREVRSEGVDQVVVGGDVLPGPLPRECLSLMGDLPVPVHFIYGNGEQDVLAAERGEELDRVPLSFHAIVRWTAEKLTAEERAALAAWPRTYRLSVPGTGDVFFCHATPRDDNEIFTRVTPEERIRPVFEATGAAVVLCGHTHMPFDRSAGAVRVVNAGSVGMPFGEPGACWALLADGDVQLRRTAYDVAAAMARIQASDYPGEFDLLDPPSEAHMVEVLEAAALE
jgi:predicted phosphodiesterase